jgi:hypothetical protein
LSVIARTLRGDMRAPRRFKNSACGSGGVSVLSISGARASRM